MTEDRRWRRDQASHCSEGEAGHQELLGGNTSGSRKPEDVSTKLQQIAKKARDCPDMAFRNIAYLMDVDMLRHSFRQLRRKAAAGIDGVTYEDYSIRLSENLESLHVRLKGGRYKAPPVRRVWIEKDDGKKRPLGIPVLEDKIVQKAASDILSAIVEQDFCDFSYGFRKGRNQHQALGAFRDSCNKTGAGWIVDMDIQGYFDSIDHGRLREFLKRRIADKNFLRLIGKWLKAGVFEDGTITYSETGSPQGGVISPVLSNIFLHHILDVWFRDQILPALKGRAGIVRYADDAVFCFSNETDAGRFMKVLPKRFAKYGLTIHPGKTKLIRFVRPKPFREKDRANGTFDFLGFTHFWGKTRSNCWVIKRKTASKKLRRKMKDIWRWCKYNRHMNIHEQFKILCSKLRGHYQYYGVRCNMRSLEKYYRHVLRAWRCWLGHRHSNGTVKWEEFRERLEKYFHFPTPRIIHSI